MFKNHTKICPHCHPAPATKHTGRAAFYFEKAVANSFARLLFPLLNSLTPALQRAELFFLLQLVRAKILHLEAAPDETQLRRRALIFFHAAQERGLPIYALRWRKKYLSSFIAEIKNKKFCYEEIPLAQFSAADFIDDKIRVKKLLLKNNLPAPAGDKFISPQRALQFARTLNYPLVVKPSQGSLSRHATYPIHTETELMRAIKIARAYYPEFIVEEFITGSLFRATVIGRQHVFVCAKKPRPEAKSILAAGCEIHNKTAETHPKNIELFKKIAALLQTDLVGLDFICPDISLPYTEQKCGIIEANSLPYADMHAHPTHGEPEPIAQIVWEVVEKNFTSRP